MADEKAPLLAEGEDCYLTGSFHFRDSIGLRIPNFEWAWVSKVDADTQAARLGVEPGSTIMYLNGLKYTEEALQEVMASKEPFTMTFRRTANPDDLCKDRFSHEYKDHLMLAMFWVGLAVAICGAIATISVLANLSACADKAVRSRLMWCGIAWIVSGSLLWALQWFARMDRLKPFNSALVCCSGISYGTSLVLTCLWFPATSSVPFTCTVFWMLPLWSGFSCLGGGGTLWYISGTRAQLGIGWLAPSSHYL